MEIKEEKHQSESGFIPNQETNPQPFNKKKMLIELVRDLYFIPIYIQVESLGCR